MKNKSVFDSESLRKYKKEFNFFETPTELADKMANLLSGIGRDARILEPSAGRGSLIAALKRAIKYPIKPVEFCEIQADFANHIKQMGGIQVAEDFEAYNPGEVYDGIIMNPPYAKNQAKTHLNHAWDCLVPGGSIVALVNEAAASWVDDEFYGHIFYRDEMARDAFKETKIKTVLFLINKPLDGRIARL